MIFKQLASSVYTARVIKTEPFLRFWPRGGIEAYDPTAREREILRPVLQGASNKHSKKKLFISGSTVRNHPCNVQQKLDINNRLELINRIAQDARRDS
jgi:DNA-binding CsgD family transcriptional regulator